MTRMLVKPGLLALIAAGALLAAAGIAYATVPDSAGVIHSCYKTTGGGLRVIDPGAGGACNASELPLDWSQTGPKGSTGTRGATGATGATGPSAAWSVDGFESSRNLGALQLVTLASTQTLPAGSYFVEAEVNLADRFNPSPTETGYFCDLVDSSDHEYQGLSSTTPDSSSATIIPLQSVLTLAGPDTISLRCDGDNQFAEAGSWKLAAIAIGAVHQ